MSTTSQSSCNGHSLCLDAKPMLGMRKIYTHCNLLRSIGANPALAFFAKFMLITLPIVVILWGCIRTYDLDVIVSNENVLFSFYPWYGDGAIYRLNTLAVVRRDCAENCIMWEIVPNPEFWNQRPFQPPTIGRVISYGVELENMWNRQAPRPLTAGVYSVDASIVARNNSSQIAESRIFGRTFSLTRDNDGNLVVSLDVNPNVSVAPHLR